jgi:saccharopine dehydrogenase-like NADP-dependent oxidoreductase
MSDMKVVLLGAGGGMGAMAARHLARTPGVDELVLSDTSVDAASRYLADLRDHRGDVSAAAIDILDPTALRNVLAGADLVLNCAGPFFRLGIPALEAAIDTCTTYVDICDDPAPTVAMLALDERARSAGVGAVIGMGASPGLSNLLAIRAARHLDTIDDCYTAWPLDLPMPGSTHNVADEVSTSDGRPAAAVIHLMEQIAGKVDVVEAGTMTKRPPLRPIELHYPGRSAGTAYVVGHPEPLTLRDSLGLTGDSACVMMLKPTTLAFLRLIQRDLDRGRLDHHAAAVALSKPPTWKSIRAGLDGRRVAGHGGLPAFFVLLTGTKDGQAMSVGCHLTSAPLGMDGITAIPAVLAVRQLLEREIPSGVHPPERVIDPDALLQGLLPHCEPSVASVEELAPLANSTPSSR